MKKIIVIGCPGSGKSTFSKILKEKTGLPLYHLDMIYHLEDGSCISKDEFDKKLNVILKLDSFIIDGNYTRTLKMRLDMCDTVFFLDYPLDVCLQGAKDRVGIKRDDYPLFEKELNEDFKNFIIDFPKSNLPKIYELINEYKYCRKIYIFHNREESDKYLENI